MQAGARLQAAIDVLGEIEARGKLLSLQSELWSLIRDEAIDAEREVQHA